MDSTAFILETQRLRLRLWHDRDLEPYVELNADRKVTEFLPGPVTVDQAKDFFDQQNELYRLFKTCYFAAELKFSRKLIGFVGLKRQDFAAPFAPCFEVGWRFSSHHWGAGLATEGAKAVVDYGFGTLGLEEIVSFTVPENVRSRRVMERLGMKHDEGADFAHPNLPIAHPLSKHVLYRLSRRAWCRIDSDSAPSSTSATHHQ
jgi:RimJ/RimL family protein N-acetyltransferase